ncbi:hypothetical protein DQK91_22700, partial [Oceanidesulfovibrio marinus]
MDRDEAAGVAAAAAAGRDSDVVRLREPHDFSHFSLVFGRNHAFGLCAFFRVGVIGVGDHVLRGEGAAVLAKEVFEFMDEFLVQPACSNMKLWVDR